MENQVALILVKFSLLDIILNFSKKIKSIHFLKMSQKYTGEVQIFKVALALY